MSMTLAPTYDNPLTPSSGKTELDVREGQPVYESGHMPSGNATTVNPAEVTGPRGSVIQIIAV